MLEENVHYVRNQHPLGPVRAINAILFKIMFSGSEKVGKLNSIYVFTQYMLFDLSEKIEWFNSFSPSAKYFALIPI